jgi:hypothetical protein
VDASKVEERVNLLWKSICRRRTINKGVEIMYCTTASRIAVFKGLIKTHKGRNQIKIRPVVNTIGSPTYKFSWLLQKILVNVLPRPRFSQKSSDDISKDIMEKRFNNKIEYTYPFSLDVVSMYTSISAQQAVDNFCQRLADHDFVYFGVTPSDFRELFMMVLNNSYFQFEKRFDGSLSLLDFSVNVTNDSPVIHPYIKRFKKKHFHCRRHCSINQTKE